MFELTGCVGWLATPAAVTTRSSIAIVLMACLAVESRSAEPKRDVARYAARVKVLVEAHEQLLKDHRRILERKRELQTEYVQAQAAVERLQVEAAVNQVKALRASLSFPAVQEELGKWLESPPALPSQNLSLTLRARQLELWAQELKAASRRINTAGRATVDHMRECIEQALALQREAAELQSRYGKLQEDFETIADIGGQRCREELEAAVHQLGIIGDHNPAALLVRGVALRRLHRFDDAQADFDRVIHIGGACQAVALAARGESLVAEGKSREGIADLNRAVTSAKSDPRVLYLHAQGLAADGKYRYAERAWKRLLVAGGYDAYVHRNLAFLYSASGDMWRRPEVALEHAEIACDRTDMSEWSCLLAFSTTKAANEEYDLAIEWAESAAAMALGDKRELCHAFIEQYQAREQPTWDWKK